MLSTRATPTRRLRGRLQAPVPARMQDMHPRCGPSRPPGRWGQNRVFSRRGGFNPSLDFSENLNVPYVGQMYIRTR